MFLARSMQKAANIGRTGNKTIASRRLSRLYVEETRVHERPGHLRCQQTHQAAQVLIALVIFLVTCLKNQMENIHK